LFKSDCNSDHSGDNNLYSADKKFTVRGHKDREASVKNTDEEIKMKEFLMQLPIWYVMIVLTFIVGAVGYRLIKKGVKIKVGPVEIDAEDDAEPEKKVENIKE